MPRLQLYLDTSVISHLFHEDTPERMEETSEFFENTVTPRVHEVFVSPVVIDELSRTKDVELRSRFLDVITRFDLSVLPSNEVEVNRLATLYIRQGILPSKKPEDAFHVAYATVFELDVLVTWNFRHLAKARTSTLIAGVNLIEGYSKPLRLLTPLEVLAP